MEEDRSPEVLRNRIVLGEIFKYLPTSTLISSCSLVNKHWREESRSFIRDYRECTVNLGVDTSPTLDQPTNLWEQLCELDRDLEKMATVPFNSIRLVVTPSNNTSCDKRRPRMNTLPNLMSRLALKYLRVVDASGMKPWIRLSCLTAASVLELIQYNSSTLLELEIRSSRTDGRVFKDWEPPQRFEKLKRLSISRHIKAAKKIIFGASNLKSIYNNCLHMIPDVIPEDMYGAFKRLIFGVGNVDSIEKFAPKLDQLEELVVDFGASRESAPKIRCLNLFQKLLALNVTTLCSIGVRCHGHEDALLLNQLQLPLLPSVTTLFIFVEHFESLLNITALNFRECLPNLSNVHIRGWFSDNTDANADIVLQQDVIVAPNASETTMELTIDGMITTPHLATLRSLFPNVIKLSFTSLFDFPPLGFAGILWPNLESLNFFGRRIKEEKVGAQVFGINPEEWKLLRQQDKQVLKIGQLVPSCSSVLEMRELKHFQFQYRCRADCPDVEPFLRFLEPLVMDRMPGLSLKIKKDLTDPSWSTPRFKDLF